jgi:hypothetical protein
MVIEGKGCNIGVEHLGIAEVTNPRGVHNSLDEDLDAALSGLINLIVLNHESRQPRQFWRERGQRKKLLH